MVPMLPKVAEVVAAELLKLLPLHECELMLSHNPHRSSYESVEAWELSAGASSDWVSTEERDKAIATQDFWELHWYPDTPVGFIRRCAHDLAMLLAAGNP